MSKSGHVTAKINGIIIAASEKYEVVESNIYFPPESLKTAHFTETKTTTFCPWKGIASYYTIKVGDEVLEDAAWYYPDPKEKALSIKGYVAFYKSKVEIDGA
ncbi:DUF427-domain-containing protein [Eremomyces bilateralis CBS 781.70]|uniref:DUF427-domain-containing protein n=1 Tax=Eremomyces bilateralis CBS 781.70 TaxID=1392243 RepID=A0A6G1FRD9_9PEZI|nr:DUF427-domain-containing protein [Eremomyces bilateralis CBS 781.70]KAF1808298.1 DUF427-domain-containing protein [Eremomyces bilateralis CBS 781.70]